MADDGTKREVSALRHRLPVGVAVGTVDKFQAQQAPIVVYSMASSSATDAPRGMEFLYSAIRSIVATWRLAAPDRATRYGGQNP